MRPAVALVVACCTLAPAAQAADHPCASDAVKRARGLLRFHVEAPAEPIGDGASARPLAPVRALKGNGLLDVLEVTSHIYKADYRMRFIYARSSDASCTLLGQEILEASNPY